MCHSPSMGERIVSASDDGIVPIWDARLTTEAKEEIDSDWVNGVAISGDGTAGVWRAAGREAPHVPT